MKQIRKCVFLITLGLFSLTFLFPSFAQKGVDPQAMADQYYKLGRSYFFYQTDSCIYYMNKSLQKSEEIGYQLGIAKALNSLGEVYRVLGDIPHSFSNQMKALEIYRELSNIDGEAATLIYIGSAYVEISDLERGFEYLRQADQLLKGIYDAGQKPILAHRGFLWTNMGYAHQINHQLDSALKYQLMTLEDPEMKKDTTPVITLVLRRIGKIEYLKGNYNEALEYYRKSFNQASAMGYAFMWDVAFRYTGMAETYIGMGKIDSAQHYAKLGYESAVITNRFPAILEASELLSKIYSDKGQFDSAYHFQEITIQQMENLFGVDKLNQLHQLVIKQKVGEEHLLREKENATFRSWLILMGSILFIFLMLAIFLIWNNKNRKKANTKLQEAYDKLKSTQAQLIQSEKMASLGELTAGIAHEIQNPLNFVNNFSEVSAELVGEIEEVRAKSQEARDETLVSEILGDIKQNLEKINHHGKRADAIVKGMLEHSRAGSGEKVPTDINALADEYLRLSFHGMRAKDKSFNADFKTEFDANLPKVNVVPQDIGRVLLNIINNAFQACAQKDLPGFQNLAGLTPKVTVSTKNLGDKIEISISDNGPGIPDAIKDKIFQPFFTTKPTGQGTGLGLSLAYDIVKSHGGELTVKTHEGQGSEFIITLPIKH
ncbi:ATP-binding protein [Aquiflexum sp.]|uniref:tetratricopeptide repeat-containing sensor histidine kinase n=1 Tax=Aquiflexum sp. TaxID=1872584 RepID=UPI003593D440